MNTRQKLTLGIAAIFMITLTIVGVTYAYFVTIVNGTTNGDEAVNVQTAEIASIEYEEGNGVVEMKDVLPGETVYKSFTVRNTDANITGVYDVYMSAVMPDDETIEFVHTNDTTSCYTETAYSVLHGEDEEAKTALTDACFVAEEEYNNIKYSLYRVSELPEINANGNIVDENDEVVEFDESTIIQEEGSPIAATGNVPSGKTKANPATLFEAVNIEPNAEHYYVLKVEYFNVVGNQNIEQDAALNILVDIVK